MKKCIKMYENKQKNPHETGIKNLDNFLLLLADLNTEIELFALGGTAMVLKGIKEATKDIDFITTIQYDNLRSLFKRAGLKEQSKEQLCNIWHFDKTRIDIFYGSFILGVQLPEDWKELSQHIKNIGKIKLYILNKYDLIITKIARCEKRDIDDCLLIIQKLKVDFSKLKDRYYSIAETSIIADYDEKFKALEKKI
jgi:hypothetical protein